MELRLALQKSDVATVVHVDGRLAAGLVGELERFVRGLSGPIFLDLSQLVSVDDAGVTALRLLARRGLTLVGASPYIALLLDGTAHLEERSARPARRRGTP